MSVKFELYMSEEDTNKVFALKKEAGEHYDNYTANDFAEILLHRIITKEYPEKVQRDEITMLQHYVRKAYVEDILKLEFTEENSEKIIDTGALTKSEDYQNFSTAALVFGDNNRIEKYDDIHSFNEDRYITIGEINGVAIIVMVVYTERKKATRIISARLATKREKEAYYNAKKY